MLQRCVFVQVFRFTGCGLLAVVLLCLLACSQQTEQPGLPPPLVSVITVHTEDVPLSGDYVAQAVGSLAVQVRAQVGGILKKRHYIEGDYVNQGQVLFEIDPDTYQAAYDQAKAKLSQAAASLDQSKREWNRIQPLYAKNAVSQKDRDTAQAAYNGAVADYEAAQAVLEEARIKLGYAYVTAPISGYTSKESWSEGNLISTSGDASLLTVINQPDPIYIDFAIPSAELQRARRLISEGRAEKNPITKARLSFADGTTYNREGEVTFIDTRVDPATSVIKSRAVFSNPDRIVLPGQYFRITIWGVTLKNALLIPQSATIQTQQGTLVMVLDEHNVPQSRIITLDTQGLGNNFIVTGGLKPGDRLVVEGVNKVRPGQPVRLTPPAGPHDTSDSGGAGA